MSRDHHVRDDRPPPTKPPPKPADAGRSATPSEYRSKPDAALAALRSLAEMYETEVQIVEGLSDDCERLRKALRRIEDGTHIRKGASIHGKPKGGVTIDGTTSDVPVDDSDLPWGGSS